MADDLDLLNVGKQCSQPLCRLVDFLPFKCQHCKKSFCQDHFKVEAHSCEEYDETKFNRVAPNCPLCNTPIAIRPGEDPNIRMDRHLETECYVMTGKSQKTSSKPRCAHQTCQKILFSPIRCDKCNHQFCPAHRFPDDHTCNPQPVKAARPAAGPSLTRASNLLAKFDVTAKKLTQSTSTTTKSQKVPSAPAVKAASSSSATPATAPASSSKQKAALPFSKTDRLPSVSVSFPSSVMSSASTPATTDNALTIDATTSNSTNNNPPSLFNVSSFIPRPLFASA